jgi:hypothetical protein
LIERLPIEEGLIMSNVFWLADESWQALQPLIPMNRPGVSPNEIVR